MILSEVASCPGHKRISGTTLGICVACDRRTKPTGERQVWMAPAARRLADGEWTCDERRSTGTPAHGASVAPDGGGVGTLQHGVDCAPFGLDDEDPQCGGGVLPRGGNGGVSL
jgi:hypothetical protein